MDIKGINVVVLAQIAAGVAAIGAIFSDGQVSVYRVIVGGVAFSAMLASIMVAINASVESDRMHQYLETLIRSVSLPYFIVRNVSDEISEITRQHGWSFEWQENFENATVYHFKKIDDNVHGSLIVSDAEFKDLWILRSKIRNGRLQVLMFGGGGWG
ncbi:hypothetical protein V5F53_01760 [Xanthobacter sp. V4C-4]|uniref:hypothetical protein n=1 Tax=Xanthobacter cornucopiae TaxID=3119924 RepID=UPI00372A44F7